MAPKQSSKERLNNGDETRAADTATVAWMLAVMSTLVCQSVAAITWLAAHDREGAERIMIFSGFLQFSAIITGVVSLVLMAVVLKVRHDPPPRSIVVFSAIISLAPLAVTLYSALAR